MRKLILVLTVCLLFGNTQAQTNVPGGTVSGTWALAGSPYNVTGSIMVPNDSTLTIQPGVTVNFQGTYKLFVSGRLLAVGTSVDSITFTASNPGTGWRGIDFDNTATTNDTSRISYCKITRGRATGGSSDYSGGAIYVLNMSKLVVTHNRISNNYASQGGGGVYCSGNAIFDYNKMYADSANYGGAFQLNLSPKVQYNTIISNAAVGSNAKGGGIDCYASSSFPCSALIDHNTINNNIASWGGGGVALEEYTCNPILSYNDISHNTTPGVGGGVLCYFGIGTACQFAHCTITFNTGGSGGGGFWLNNGSRPTISYSVIANNTLTSSTSYGGGIACTTGGDSPNISNTIIVNNNANKGGGLYVSYGLPVCTNVTVTNNSAANGGALYCLNNSDCSFRNTIMWGNTATTAGPQVFLFDDNSDPYFYYCDVQGGSAAIDANGNFYTGTYTGCINVNPNFVSPSGGSGVGFNGVTANWALQSTSPCRDAGDPTFSPYPLTDLAGNPRQNICRIDIGAYEYQGGVPVSLSMSSTNATCHGTCNGTATANASGGSGIYTYSWAPTGGSAATVTGLCAGTYTVTVTESSGCVLTGTVTITQPPLPSSMPLCLVTVDSAVADHNIVYWDKSAMPADLDSFRIYREVTTGVYSHIASVYRDSLSEYHDYGANPNVTSYKYKLGVIDTCGNGSVAPYSLYHSTIHLQVLGGGNLQWTLYDIESSANPVTYYRVLRDDIGGTGNFLPISTTIPGGNTTYTDIAYASYPTADYRMEVTWSITCSPTRTLINTTRSNIKHQNLSTSITQEGLNKETSIYPNPAQNEVTIELTEIIKTATINIYNALGQKVCEEKMTGNGTTITTKHIDVSSFSKGIYTISIESNGTKVFKKLVVN